jgi:hypothetical protein
MGLIRSDSVLLTTGSEVTLHISQAAVQLILDVYRAARPEEFKVVSKNYKDGNPQIAPIPLNNHDEMLDYAVRITNILVDTPPSNPSLQSPIPPKAGEFELVADLAIEFKDFVASDNTFPFGERIWLLFRPVLAHEAGDTVLGFKLISSRISNVGPEPIKDFAEHVVSLLIANALQHVRIPTSMNLQGVLTLVALDTDVRDHELEALEAIYSP